MARRLAHRSRGRIGPVLQAAPGIAFTALGNNNWAQTDQATLVLDGCIFNELELRTAVGPGFDPLTGATAGITGFQTAAGLALALYLTDGLEGLLAINGDVAMVIYDAQRREVILFRDRFGIKPLYYTYVGKELLVASEIKAFTAHPQFHPQVDGSALFDYLATHYRYIHRVPDRTYWDGVKQVPASHYLTVSPEKNQLRRYWRLELEPRVGELDTLTAAQGLLDLFKDSVKLRLLDHPCSGFSVSSGMDSSSVCSMAAMISSQKQKIYSVGYQAAPYDETEGIRALAERHAASWRVVQVVDPPLLDTINHLIDLADGPICTVTWLSHYMLAQAAANDGLEVIFSGLGGDETLSGEYEHFLFFFAELQTKGWLERLDLEVTAWERLHDHPVFRKSRRLVAEVFTNLVDLSRPGVIYPDWKRYRAYHEYFSPEFIRAWDQPLHMDNPFSSYLANRCYQDLFYETTPPCLTADEKNVAYFGMTTRFPFLDHRLVQFCFSLSPLVKYDHGVTKAVMRRAMNGILPETNRTNLVKTGFNAPAGQWLSGSARHDIWDLINSPSLRNRQWFRPGALESLFEAHLLDQANHTMFLWQVLNAELWLESSTRIRRGPDE